MLYNKQEPQGFEPWLQIIDIKKIKPASGAGSDRYRIILSDGTSFISGMLATQLVPLMQNESLKENFVVQLKDYLGNDVQGRRILIVLSLGEIKPAYERIGNPQSIESINAGRASTPSLGVPVPKPLSIPSPSVQSLSINQLTRTEMTSSTHAVDGQSSISNHKGSVVREDPNIRLSDIQSLNPYAGGRWTIKARVTNRAPIKNWTNARGQGKLFSIDLLDSKGGEIRATMFNDAVDKFYDVLRPGQVFYFSGGKIRMANRKFSSVNNDYEITFDQHSEISLASDDRGIQQMNYNFKKIGTLEKLPADANIDVIGVVKQVEPMSEIISKAGKQLFKRDLVLVDDSMAEVRVTLWNERAQEDCSSWTNNVLAIKGCRISEYNGRSIGTLSSSSFNVNPTIPEAGFLLSWYNNGGSTSETTSLSVGSSGFGGGSLGSFAERANLMDIKARQLGFDQKPDYITVKGTVNYIKHDSGLYYQACTKCNKKVIADVAQNYSCEKCQTVYKTCENRYIMSLVIADHTGSSWVTCFNDQGRVILNKRTADEIAEIKDTNTALFEAVFKEALFKSYVWRLRIKAENVQGESRVKVNVVNLEPIDYVKESKDLLHAISKYTAV
uniref:Replication protein A subunit n=1 Tax=Albugo laibachii Nc14 TaxID=890382 RepID=F0WKI4_9STRA|nr:replication protein A 70 kDa DNAbinding subunit puta [Albugo laibachii Nc14]|eukprot:CCA21790.1 replication protein A 70 kDa DNAbinding subunit puta [Albugo laibachii Nc14]